MAYTPAQYAERMKHRVFTVQKSMFITEDFAVEQIRAAAISMVSGPISTKELAALGHPFGRSVAGGARHYSPSRILSVLSGGRVSKLPGFRGRWAVVSRLPINVQTGELLKSLRIFKRNTSRFGGYYQLQFMSPHSVVLTPGGTRRMVDRGFWTALNAYARKVLHDAHAASIKVASEEI